MWKVASGLHRVSLGALRSSLREDGQQYSQGQRLLSSLNSSSECLRTFSSVPSTAVETSQPQECGILHQLLPTNVGKSQQHHFLQQSPSHEFTSSLCNGPYSRFNNDRGYDDYAGERRGEGWNLLDVFHGSTALVLSYNLIHQQRENSGLSAYCSWKTLKHSKGASAQPIHQASLSSLNPETDCRALFSESNLSSLNHVSDPSSPHAVTDPSSLAESQSITPAERDVLSESSQSLCINQKQGPKTRTEQKQDSLNAKNEALDQDRVEVGREFQLELDSVQGIQLLQAGHPAGIRQLKAQSRRGSSISSFYLGMAYEQGHLVSRNLVTATKYYQQAAKQGNPEALYNLAAFHQAGLGGLQRDPAEAVRLLKQAAEAGLPAARQALGLDQTKVEEESKEESHSGRDLYLLGQSFESLGETAIALDMYTRALDAGYARARRAKQRLDSLSTSECSA